MKWITILLTLFSSVIWLTCQAASQTTNHTTSQAAYFEGKLRKNLRSFSLEIPKENKSYEIIYPEAQIKSILDKLSSGDLIAVQAVNQKNSLKIQRLISVGMQNLIGRWESFSSSVQFINFSDLEVTSYSTHKKEKVKYTLMPGEDKEWQIVLLTKNIQVGWIEFSSEEELTFEWIEEDIEDPFTGALSTTEVNSVKK